MGIQLPYITAKSHFDRAETSNFFIVKIVFAFRSFVVLLYQNNLATIATITRKSYAPELQKINMFVNIGVKYGY